MRYNPCGRVVDVISHGYDTQCRFWQDSDEVGTIHWYEALPGAPTIGYPTAIYSSLWDINDGYQPPVGEIVDATKTFTGAVAPAGVRGDHVCGDEDDFADGGDYDDTLPPVKYGSLGLPLCCNPPVGVVGGVSVGGRADVSRAAGVAVRGGVAVGGRATAERTGPVDPAQGGVEIGGEVGDVMAGVDAPAGGVEIGGEVGDVYTPAGGGYTNGVLNGSSNAYNIGTTSALHNTSITSDSFEIGGALMVSSGRIGLWVFPGEVPTKLDWAVGTSQFDTSLGSGTASVSPTFVKNNIFGFDVYDCTFALSVALVAGTYWLTLRNAFTTVSQVVYWDQNSGPSLAWNRFAATDTSIPSEFFSIG